MLDLVKASRKCSNSCLCNVPTVLLQHVHASPTCSWPIQLELQPQDRNGCNLVQCLRSMQLYSCSANETCTIDMHVDAEAACFLKNFHHALCMCNAYMRCVQEVSKEDRMAVRTTAIDQVLGTDMKKHFSILSRFQVRCFVNPGICS